MTKFDTQFLHARNAVQFADKSKLNSTSLVRQMLTAQRILEQLFFSPKTLATGTLLADDVGLGKTTIGAIVAWVAASGGADRSVRILAPNAVVRQRWEDELRRVLPALQHLAPELRAVPEQIRQISKRLEKRHIHVTTVGRATARQQIRGDLIIVDEAHRSKSDASPFRKAMKIALKKGTQTLFLTATPMSVDIREMAALLKLLKGTDAAAAVTEFGKQIAQLYNAEDRRGDDQVAKELVAAATNATNEMQSCVVRHTIEGLLPKEQAAFGNGHACWDIAVPDATPQELELLSRMDRIIRLAHPRSVRSNDPQFHVARTPLIMKLEEAELRLKGKLQAPIAAVHIAMIHKCKLLQTPHPKMIAVTDEVAKRVGGNEKVVVFCHHHLVAAELTRHMANVIPNHPPDERITDHDWREAWTQLIEDASLAFKPGKDLPRMRERFICWICGKPFKHQILGWVGAKKPITMQKLLSMPAPRGGSTIGEAMVSLFQQVMNAKSKSTVQIFRQLARGGLELFSLPFGSANSGRVLGACDPDRKSTEKNKDAHLFLHETRPDLLLALFNSPFGPDVIILTDKYSEGIDLHRACRLMVHYELDPSPTRTIQREGRIRRINNWASHVGEPVEYAMPAFRGTRDQRLVEIMGDRMKAFGLLLGGSPPLTSEDVDNNIDQRAKRILARCRPELNAISKKLQCRRKSKM